jgi:hypothetical protein
MRKKTRSNLKSIFFKIPRRILSKSTTNGDSCGNKNIFWIGGGVIVFSNDGEIFGTGGVGIRGNDVCIVGVTIGIAISSASDGIGDWCRLTDVISCTSYDLNGLILRGYGSTLSLIISSTNIQKRIVL